MLRKPDSIPSGDVVITDEVMEPYFITRSTTGGFTVFERVVKGEKNTEYIKTISYPSTFSNALRTVAREILNTKRQKSYSSIQSYITEWDKINESLTAFTNL